MQAQSRTWTSPATFGSALVLVVAVSFADGGFFRESWVWTTIALACLAAIVLLQGEDVVLGRLELVWLALVTALVTWIALSATWSDAPESSLQEAERGLIYVGALLAFVLLVTRDRVPVLLAGVAAGTTLVATYSLAARLLSNGPLAIDPVQQTRLLDPLGYANALGVLAAMGLLLSLGLVAHARSEGGRALAAASAPLLTATLVFTESRASSVALVAGLAVWLLVDPRRPAVLAALALTALPASLAAWITLEATGGDWRRALGLALLAAATGTASRWTGRLGEALGRSRAPARMVGAVGVAACLIGLIAAAFRADRALGPRLDYWRVALEQWNENRMLGSGAGTYAEHWRREGELIEVLDAHSVYLEALGELGPLGVALLVCALGTPLLAVSQARRQPLAGAAAGAFAAYLVHAGLDWDWEMPAVTLTALLCGVALVASARSVVAPVAIGRRGRAALLLAAATLAALAVLGAATSGSMSLVGGTELSQLTTEG